MVHEAVRCTSRAETARAYFLHVGPGVGVSEKVGSVGSRSTKLRELVEAEKEDKSSHHVKFFM